MTDAGAVVAQVSRRASAAVVASSGFGRMLAFAGKTVVITARFPIVAHRRTRFIGLAVAVVVFLVALFDGCA